MSEDVAAVSPYPYYPPHISVSHNFWTNIRSCMKLLDSLTRLNCKLVSDINITCDKTVELSDLIPLWQLSSFLRNFLRNIQQKHVTLSGFYSGSSLRAFTIFCLDVEHWRIWIPCIMQLWGGLPSWEFARPWLVGCWWHFGSTYRSYLQRSGEV